MGVRRKMFGADGQLMLWQEPHFYNPFDRLYDVVRLSDADWPLISAAPEMLDVLKELDAEYDVPIGIHDRIKAAIAKAEGRAEA